MVVLARERSRALAGAAAAAALVVVPVQALRGWMWGGTLELNSPGSPLVETFAGAVAGFLRSAYAFVKTAMWVGGQSLRRPPRWLVVAYFAWLAAVAARRSAERRAGGARSPTPRPRPPAAVGFAVFAVANRRFYGVWGGVGGWYLWTWSPWIAEAASDLASIPPRPAQALLWLEAALVAAANAAWIADGVRFYGG